MDHEAADDHSEGSVTALEQIAGLRARIEQIPGNPALRNRLASLLQAEGRLDDAIDTLQETLDRFPKNVKAQERLRLLVEGPASVRPQDPAPVAASVLPAFEAVRPLEGLPVFAYAPHPQPAWSVVQEPLPMPIRLTRRVTAEMIGGFAILLVLGGVWTAWRVLPESHLLQPPAMIVTEAAIPPAATIVIDQVRAPASVFVQVEAADPKPHQETAAPPKIVAADAPPALPQAMPAVVMILYERTGTVVPKAASRLAARLQAAHLPVGAPLAVAGVGQPGIGYFYAEDRAEAEALQRRFPDMAPAIRLISGAARAAQQPGAVAVVIR